MSFTVEWTDVLKGKADWGVLAEQMDETSTALSGASTSGMPPSVLPSARAFLDAWSGFAGESSTLATGFADALQASMDQYGDADAQAGDRYADLDGRLGPAR